MQLLERDAVQRQHAAFTDLSAKLGIAEKMKISDETRRFGHVRGRNHYFSDHSHFLVSKVKELIAVL